MSSPARKILLTGGAGFIGSHVAEALLRCGAQVTVVDNFDDFYSAEWKRANLDDVRGAGSFELVEADICSAEALRPVFQHAQPEIVIHLAARAGVRPSIEKPRLYEQVNVGGTTNLLELAREFNVKKFILGSSSSVYGATSRAPFSESQPELRPISPYAATKLACEMLCYTYAHLYQLPVVCLRFFTVYGPRQRPDLAIHKFTALIEKGKPVPVFGDGSTGRDYTYIDDIVAGVLASLDYSPSEGNAAPFEILNLGNSSPIQLKKLIELLEEATGKKASRESRPLQPGDVPLTWADVSKAGRLIGFRPATPIQEGLRRFVAWYRAADPKRRA